MSQAGEKEFRLSIYRRLGYPAAGLAVLAAAAFRAKTTGDADALRAACVVAFFSAMAGVYLQSILLRVGESGVFLRWPLMGARRISWDEITRVRRSSAPPGRDFFIDLYASPDVSLQFNPFVFEKPDEIIEELNKHLKFDLIRDEPGDGKIEPGEIALAAEPAVAQRPLWALPLLIGVAAAIALYCLLS